VIDELAEQVITLAARKKATSAACEDLDALTTRADAITAALNTLKEVAVQIGTLEDHEIAVTRSTALVETARKAVEDLTSKIQSEPDYITTPRALNEMTIALKQLCDELKTRIGAAWFDYVDANAPSINDDTLSVLARIPALRAQVKSLQRTVAAIKAAAETPPTSTTRIERIKKDIKEAETTLSEFASDRLPDCVFEFLRAAGQAGASLDLLTPDVLDWLTKEGLTSSFQVCVDPTRR